MISARDGARNAIHSRMRTGMSDMLATLLARIESRSATVGIIGLGYVGLPLARAFARTGFTSSASTSTP